MTTPIEAIGYYVLVEPETVEETTKGGIIIPQSTVEQQQHAITTGIIKSVGPGAASVKPEHIGKKAMFGRYAGVMFKHEGKDYRLIDSQEIRGVLG